MAAHAPSTKRYVLAWLGLLALTGVTVGAAGIPPGWWSVPIALGIASLKASVVLVVFMHLLEHPPAVRLVLATSLVFVALLIAFVQTDVTRRFEYARPRDATVSRP